MNRASQLRTAAPCSTAIRDSRDIAYLAPHLRCDAFLACRPCRGQFGRALDTWNRLLRKCADERDFSCRLADLVRARITGVTQSADRTALARSTLSA